MIEPRSTNEHDHGQIPTPDTLRCTRAGPGRSRAKPLADAPAPAAAKPQGSSVDYIVVFVNQEVVTNSDVLERIRMVQADAARLATSCRLRRSCASRPSRT